MNPVIIFSSIENINICHFILEYIMLMKNIVFILRVLEKRDMRAVLLLTFELLRDL